MIEIQWKTTEWNDDEIFCELKWSNGKMPNHLFSFESTTNLVITGTSWITYVISYSIRGEHRKKGIK